MPLFIENPRRAPRAPVRCEARVALREGGFWAGPTSDYGPRGCQVSAPLRLDPGSRLFLELVNERVAGPFQLSGRVAWSSTQPPWRSGIAFDEGSVTVATRFFDRLAAAYPGLDTYGRAPDRIPADGILAPLPPPAVEPLLTVAERDLIRAVGPGATPQVLRSRFGDRWLVALNATFSLLGRRYLTMGSPDPAAARAWEPLLMRPTVE
ncbi:MAG TPA: PilZ domain-containing protein [Anaeromyxobacter sp.]|nr:PilZ domain-containing protein [Anaeromyxobacter sp.]